MKSMNEAAIVKRINRALASEDEKLRKSRGGWTAANFGDFYVHDWRRNIVTATHVDPEDLARELGVL